MLMRMWMCLSCIYFFFFKQKTAYEMRISDWSSDVCSSDLQIRAAIQAGYALIPGNAKRAGPGTSLDVVLGGIDDGWSYDAMDTMELRIPGAPRADEIVLAVAYATGRPNARIHGASVDPVKHQIGRASGRERGGQ